MSKVDHYHCCRSPDAAFKWVAPAGEPPATALTGEIAERDQSPPIRFEPIAFHEAGHCMAALALGGSVSAVTIDAQPHAQASARGIENKIGISIAGKVAELWRDRRIVRPYDDELLPFLERVEACTAGSCDDCNALRLSSLLAAPGADMQATLAVFRAIEASVIALMTTPAIAAAVRVLAGRLMEIGTVDGPEILTIAQSHFMPGAFSITP